MIPRHIVLASLPWASTTRPSIALGILTTIANEQGWDCTSVYPTMEFADEIGIQLYEGMAETAALIGMSEHVFATAIYGHQPIESDAYIESTVTRLPAQDRDTCRKQLLFLRDSAVPSFVQRCAARLQDTGASIFGFTCTVNQLMASLAVARRIKQNMPTATILLGGACVHDTMGEEIAAACGYIDHVFTGEAEDAFARFLQHSDSTDALCRIPGMTCNGKRTVPAEITMDLDRGHVPDYSGYFSQRTRMQNEGRTVAPLQTIPYESSRGCYWGAVRGCTFCGLNNKGMAYRYKSPRATLAEILDMSERWGVLDFMATDNVLGMRHHRELLETIAGMPLDLRLHYEIRCDIGRDDVALMSRAGVASVQPGIESFSSRVLTLMQKGTSVLKNIQVLKWLCEYGIHPVYNILVGFPGERMEDYDAICNTIARIMHLPPPSGTASDVHVHRFSAFHEDASHYGIHGVTPMSFYRHLFPSGSLRYERVAYFFDHELPPDAPVTTGKEKCNHLIRRWLQRPFTLTARLGAGFITVTTTYTDGTHEHDHLDTAHAAALVWADRALDAGTLAERMATVLHIDEVGIAQILDELASRGYLIMEGQRCVSCVPFSSPVTEKRLVQWTERWVH